MSSSNKLTKYRPVLTATEITYLLNLCKSAIILNDTCISCIHKLSTFQSKIDNLAVNPAYITSPRDTLLESLGERPISEAQSTDLLTKEERWELSYKLYKESPKQCSLNQIYEAREHMYLSDLMSEKEMATFEATCCNSNNNKEAGEPKL